jgi:CRP-like cAMP-binding protein
MFGSARTDARCGTYRPSMSVPKRVIATNRLLDALPANERKRVLAASEAVDLVFAQVLYAPGDKLTQVYFPLEGLISLIVPIKDAAGLEVGLIGNEGMFGIPLALGMDVSSVRAVVQGAGPALRMDAAAFLVELARNEVLHRTIDRYAFVHLSQLAQTAGCNRFHVVEARLARWLLMTQDRVHADNFHVTQEFLALMLGVRRVGVTRAAQSLQNLGLIHYTRGNIAVLDRRGLKAAACGCYKADRDTYARAFG